MGIKLKNFTGCPSKQITYWEWSMVGVVALEMPKLLHFLNVSTQTIQALLNYMHNIFYAPLLVAVGAIVLNDFLHSVPRVERLLERFEILPEVDNEKIIFLSVALGAYWHIFVEYLYGTWRISYG